MKYIKSVIIVLLAVSGAYIAGCDNSTQALPAIVTIVDGWNRSLTDESVEYFNPSSFTVTVDSPISEAVATSGNVTFTCGDLGEAQLSFSLDDTRKILTITVENAYKYQLQECTLSISDEIASEGSESYAYTFTNACAVSDDFNADSQSCWTPDDSEEELWKIWDEILDNAFAFDPSASKAVYDDTRNSSEEAVRNFAIKKSVTISDEGFQIVLHIISAEGIINKDDESDEDDKLAVYIANDDRSQIYVLEVAAGDDDTQVVNILSYDLSGGGDPTIGARVTSQAYDGGEKYVRLTYAPSSVLAEVSSGGALWTEMISGAGLGPGVLDLQVLDDIAGSGIFMLTGSAVGAVHDNVVLVGGALVDGITMTDQY